MYFRIAKLYDKKDVTDAFVDVILGNARVAKTKIIDNDLNPEWNEFYRVDLCHQATHLTFDVRDKDHAYTEKIGLVKFECDQLKTGNFKNIVSCFKIYICLLKIVHSRSSN